MIFKEEPAKVLIVDDEEMNIRLIQAMLYDMGYKTSTAIDGVEALDKINQEPFDIILLDVKLPKVDGLEVCRYIKENDKTRLIPVILITALDQIEDKIMGIDAGAEEYMVKPINKIELIANIKHLLKVKKLNDTLESAENVIFTLARSIEAKDAYTQGHTDRVANYAFQIASEIHLPSEDLDIIKKGGILHDIGKIGIPDSVLNKPGKLESDEYELIKKHPVIGYDICLPLKKSMIKVLPIIRHHHEKLDGSGYPDGLKGDEITVFARITAIVDVYDALVTDRPYRAGMPVEKAFRILKEESDKGWWDKDLLEVFMKIQNFKF